jgi:hypothetical protein
MFRKTGTRTTFRSSALIIASLTMVALSASPAQADTDPPSPGAVETISASPYQLQFSPTPNAVLDEIDALSAPSAGHSLDNVTVHTVMQHLNRTLYWKTASQCDDAYEAIDDLDATINMGGWCWQPNDQANPTSSSDSLSAPGYWYPQGITSSGDAEADRSYGPDDDQLLLVDWYLKDAEGHSDGVRVSFIDFPASGSNTTYRNVLLVVPGLSGGTLTAEDLTVHGGGIAWYGHYLYVADTHAGFRVFDMDRIYEVGTSKDTIGLDPSDGQFYAHKYRYVMFEVGRYQRVIHSGGQDTALCSRQPVSLQDQLCFGFVSVDRSGSSHSLLTGEYRSDDDVDYSYANDIPVRLVRWPIDETTGLLEATGGTVNAAAAYGTWSERLQSGVSHNGIIYAPSFHKYDDRGTLVTSQIDSAWADTPWVVGPESIAHWTGLDRFFGVTESRGLRMLFWVYRADVQPSTWP